MARRHSAKRMSKRVKRVLKLTARKAATGAVADTHVAASTASRVAALSPPPPATAKSFQTWPLACMIFFSSATDFASPPEVQ